MTTKDPITISKMKYLKPIRLFIFILSTISLVRFFEAGRSIAYEKTFTHVGDSIISFFVFIITLFILGFWIYSDEKEKNTLKRKFKLYEWFYNVTRKTNK